MYHTNTKTNNTIKKWKKFKIPERAKLGNGLLLSYISGYLKVYTAVEQVVACALVTQRARVRSQVGTGFLVEVFSGFFLTCKQMSGNFRPPRSPNIIWPSSSSFHIRLVEMTECVLGVYFLSCLCCLGGGPGIGLITHPGRPSLSLCGQKKYVCDP